jgi:hypothetical protein
VFLVTRYGIGRYPPESENGVAAVASATATSRRSPMSYFENEPGRRSTAKLRTRDEAFLIAVNIAKLPSVPRQILKDIPRPPNTASRDD